MARRAAAAAAAAPSSPPKRTTRARTKTVLKEDTGAGDQVEGNATTVPAKRGRPRKTPAVTDAAKKPTAGRKVVGTTKEDVSGAKKATKGVTSRTRQVTQTNDSFDSSDDEVDVVSFHAKAIPRTTNASTTTTTTSSLTQKAKRGRPRTTKPPGRTDDTLEEDDDDELAELSQSQQRTVRSRPGTAAGAKFNTASTEKVSRPGRRPAKKETATAIDANMTSKRATNTSTTSVNLKKSSIQTGTGQSNSKSANNPPKKKVTFLDITEESDKENLPLPKSTGSQRISKGEKGLTAKPVRKPATKAATDEKETTDPVSPQKKEPLSPKKATQVAKSTLSEEEAAKDEPARPNTPVRLANKSSVKASSPFSALVSPAKKLNFGSQISLQPTTSSQPIDTGSQPVLDAEMAAQDPTIMLSPAKRPPPSPFKFSIKESPRKGGLILGPGCSVQGETSTSPTKVSPLKESPKKGHFGVSLSEWAPASSAKPQERPSWLRTPAKRRTSPSKVFQSPFMPSLVAPTSSGADDAKDDITSPLRNESGKELEVDDDLHSMAPEETGGDAMDTDPIDDGFMFAEPATPYAGPSVTYSETSHTPELVELPNDYFTEVSHTEDPFTTAEPVSQVSTPVRSYEISGCDSSVNSVRSFQGVPPPAPSPPVFTAYPESQPEYRDELCGEESDSEPALESSPTRRRSIRLVSNSDNAPTPQTFAKNGSHIGEEKLGFTPLVDKLSNWSAISPERRQPRRHGRRGIFSIGLQREEDDKALRDSLISQQDSRLSTPQSPISDPQNFEDEMVIEADDTAVDHFLDNSDEETIIVREGSSPSGAMDGLEPNQDPTTQNMLEDSSDYDEGNFGDENAVPQEATITINPLLFEEIQPNYPEEPHQQDVLPMSVTPVRSSSTYPRTIHTVSKVPLKPEGDGGLKIARKRTRSLSSSRNDPASPFTRTRPMPLPSKSRSPLKPFDISSPTGDRTPTRLPARPKPRARRESRSPSKSPTKSPTKSPAKPTADSPTKKVVSDNQVLQGAVVYTDVHTKEGADASGIFVELLTQMGARCVKSWNWNPRTSLSPVDGVDPKECKVGITHVVFKDGGVRTLEKVREANGVVKCVGVGWVLDCERLDKWVDEAEYAVDVSMIPRGGSKRRKSMVPSTLSNNNGTLVKVDSTPSGNGRRSGADPEAMQEFMRLSPTSQPSRQGSPDSENDTPKCSDQQSYDIFSTPKAKSRRSSFSIDHDRPPETPGYEYSFDFEATAAMTPATPYYLSQGAKLIQQTCPPKQLRQGLFPVSGKIEEEQSESLRIRLEAVRRKSLVWKPKIGSPLGRM